MVSQVTQSCLTLCDPMDPMEPTRLLSPWDFPGKSAGMGCHFLLQRIFPTQGLNPGLPQCRQTLYRLSHQGNPWLGTITNVCFVCLVEDFGLGFLFFSHSPQIMTVAWLLFVRPALVRVLQCTCPWRGTGFILKENKKSMMGVGDFSHKTRWTAWVVPRTTFCFYFWLAILSSSRRHHCARYQKAPRPQLSCAPAVRSNLEKFRYISFIFLPGEDKSLDRLIVTGPSHAKIAQVLTVYEETDTLPGLLGAVPPRGERIGLFNTEGRGGK